VRHTLTYLVSPASPHLRGTSRAANEGKRNHHHRHSSRQKAVKLNIWLVCSGSWEILEIATSPQIRFVKALNFFFPLFSILSTARPDALHPKQRGPTSCFMSKRRKKQNSADDIPSPAVWYREVDPIEMEPLGSIIFELTPPQCLIRQLCCHITGQGISNLAI
jgi:hypothetical protein